MERLRRENNRWDSMERIDEYAKTRINVKAEFFQAGKKNKGGLAINILNQEY
jgi:hypothetical protein